MGKKELGLVLMGATAGVGLLVLVVVLASHNFRLAALMPFLIVGGGIAGYAGWRLYAGGEGHQEPKE